MIKVIIVLLLLFVVAYVIGQMGDGAKVLIVVGIIAPSAYMLGRWRGGQDRAQLMRARAARLGVQHGT